jgi:hypothetical protein
MCGLDLNCQYEFRTWKVVDVWIGLKCLLRLLEKLIDLWIGREFLQ